MPLRIKLKPRERMIVNGAVIRNDDKRTVLTVENHSHVIRGSDVMVEEDATTPTRRAYFAIQMLLVDRSNLRIRSNDASGLLAALYTTLSAPDMQNAVMEAAEHLAAGDYYKSLAALRPVMAYERALLAPAAESIGDRAA